MSDDRELPCGCGHSWGEHNGVGCLRDWEKPGGGCPCDEFDPTDSPPPSLPREAATCRACRSTRDEVSAWVEPDLCALCADAECGLCGAAYHGEIACSGRTCRHWHTSEDEPTNPDPAPSLPGEQPGGQD